MIRIQRVPNRSLDLKTQFLESKTQLFINLVLNLELCFESIPVRNFICRNMYIKLSITNYAKVYSLLETFNGINNYFTSFTMIKVI